MSNRVLYFAYGSNMAHERFRARVPSAQFVSVAELRLHVLKFHKPGSQDGTGKCDAAHSGNDEDRVLGALYAIQESELPALDAFEGLGYGYERKVVTVQVADDSRVAAQTYLATRSDASLRPLDWYKEHVVRGARAIGLPSDYIASIEAVACDIDPDAGRRSLELAVYG
jgi:gamma-glutamylcyclotransferase (GGCT)/AIG2-like uncharacterized protein YtfP